MFDTAGREAPHRSPLARRDRRAPLRSEVDAERDPGPAAADYLARTVGETGLRFFDAEGRPVRAAPDERMIGITLERLAVVDRVVGVTGGRLNVLVTDGHTAERLFQPADR